MITEMSECNGKDQGDGSGSSAKCDFCKDEGLMENAVGFCSSCWKYLCADCMKWHGKFHKDHKLKTGDDLPKKNDVRSNFPCKIHTNYAVDMYCEEHESLLCSLCKSLTHDRCKVRNIDDVVKEVNLKQEGDTIIASLAELSLILAKQEDETNNKLLNYTKAKSAVESKVTLLKMELVEILNSYITLLEDQQQSNMESLNSKKESYGYLHQNLEDFIKLTRASKPENDLQLFMSIVEMKQQYKIYIDFHETLQKDMDDIGSFTLKDERLPELTKELSEISCLEYVADGQQSVDDECDAGNLKRDQGCQVRPAMLIDAGAMTKDQTSSIDELHEADIQIDENDDEVECGSAEEKNEKSFLNIKSCSLVENKSFSTPMSMGDCCFLPDGQIVLCETDCRNSLVFLDKDLNVTVELKPQKSDFAPKHVTAVDTNTIVVSISKLKCLQFISVMMPDVSFGQKIPLSCECNGITCSKNKLYVYSHCVDESAVFKYEGFQILSLKGQVLKKIPIFDTLNTFCLTESSNILYCGSRTSDVSKQVFLKHVRKQGGIGFQCSVDGDVPSAVASDYDENVLAFEQSTANLVVVKKDGTKKVIIKIQDDDYRKPSAVCYNKQNDTILVALNRYYSDDKGKVKMYKLVFTS